ncbi:hypothetical protein A3J61_02550 [Candidatus Nomurabacteria bacterium RIFCSPHIGHO2_02_FULL_38_15]|uniref:NTP pyrophosphohydrolase MazG-like domain-containing protein n=1 Tax=Candidatus Nomurabacteria bacterium RIFCSPHIGHO2_02_FULL_38_15 TaxID=1801752 RepID=A0A1F6VPY6_9BACT|nr:MAG: hypothetical protein A3J61_02550 [Candidatus Nomurabacteria bacterium RIFCSPHIGHO2_02_FULL_38_15]
MKIEKMQNRVETWVSQKQHAVKYFPPFQIMAQLAEEVAELESAMLDANFFTDKFEEVQKELGDVLFVLMCLANSKNLSPVLTKDPQLDLVYNQIVNEPRQKICKYLHQSVGSIAREVSHTDGFKKKKPGEQTDSLETHIGRMLYCLDELRKLYWLNTQTCFNLTMRKKESRDKFRFAKTPH